MPLEAIGLAFPGLLTLTVLVLDLTGVLHRGTGFRWQATGFLIMSTALDARVFAHDHGWAGSQITALDRATGVVMLAGFAALVVGLVIQLRESQKARRAG